MMGSMAAQVLHFLRLIRFWYGVSVFLDGEGMMIFTPSSAILLHLSMTFFHNFASVGNVVLFS
jgi:hypothetical protein